MPPLTEEEKAEVRVKVTELVTAHQRHCAFRYNQLEEVKKTEQYRDREGVCFGMSLDWLRRKMFNVCNPHAKPKRDFNDQKYNSASKRVQLTEKHGQLQDAYQDSKAKARVASGKSSAHISAMVAANVVKAGLQGLTVKEIEYHHSYEFDESPEAKASRVGNADVHLKFSGKLKHFVDDAAKDVKPVDGAAKGVKPGVGIFFHMEEPNKSGHAVALVLTPREIRFFDPNIGEFFFDYSAELTLAIEFVSRLWFDVYHTYCKFDKVEFESLTYD